MSGRMMNKSMKKERKLTLVAITLMSASILMFSVWLSTGYGKDKLPIYIGVVAAIVILWFTSIMLIRKNRPGESTNVGRDSTRGS